MPQPFFGSITLLAQTVLTEGSTNGYGEVAKVIHANAISGATGDKLRHSLRLRGAQQKNAGGLPFPQAEHFQFVPSVPVRGRVFGQNHVIASCSQALSKLLRCSNYVRADFEVSALQLKHTMFYGNYICVNKQNAQRKSSADRSIEDQGQLGLFAAIS
jgi:hypothetical protein